MVKAVLFVLLLAAALPLQAGRLTGFTLVDPSTMTVRQGDLALDGAQAAAAPGAGADIDGKGLYLVPAFWDLKSSLWGNDSAKDYRELAQEMGIAQCLRVQLFYGVAHVGAAHMEAEWIAREAKRAEALEFPAAELIYPDRTLAGPGCRDWAAVAISSTAGLEAALAERKRTGAPFVQIAFLDVRQPVLPGLPAALRSEAVKAAVRQGLKAYVFVETWADAAQAVEAGASVIHGFPEGLPPAGLIRAMKAKGSGYAPALNAFLETQRYFDSADARQDPFVAASVSKAVLDSFIDPKGLWDTWRWSLEEGKRRKPQALKAIKKLSDAGVPILNATDGGWIAACFQGFGTHAGQAWMETAGMKPWARLQAVTSGPAQFLGRRCGFAPGDSADYIALEADPLGPAANLRKIAFLVHRGEKVSLDKLKPDLRREAYRSR